MPSTNELAAFYRINPATAARGLAMLADEGLLEKRRGVGMLVAAGAREQLVRARRGGSPSGTCDRWRKRRCDSGSISKS